LLAARQLTHPQAYPIDKQIHIVIAQRPTCRVEIPRKKASRISSDTSSARR
jgi:hypothetical protein